MLKRHGFCSLFHNISIHAFIILCCFISLQFCFFFPFCVVHLSFYNNTIVYILYSIYVLSGRRGGLMVSALVPGASGPVSSPGRGRCVVFLGKTLNSPRCINGYRQIVVENLTNCGGMTCDGLASCPGGVEILLAASCYRNRDKLRQLWSSRNYGFIFFFMY